MRDWTVTLPVRGRAKARPRVTRHGTYMPADYMRWRRETAMLVKASGMPEQFTGPVQLTVLFDSDSMHIHVQELEGLVRPKHVRADVDNLVGAVMDMLQDAGVIANDRLVLAVEAYATIEEDKR